MTAPRLEIDLGKIQHNATTLVQRLDARGISVTGVTKAVLGAPEVANVLLQAGVSGLGDSRLENLKAMRAAGILAPLTLLRSPMLSQVSRVVTNADVSFNTEIDVIRALASAARTAQVTHGVVLMIELGDLREGVMPNELNSFVRETLACSNIELTGIGTNLACRSGVSPDDRNMAELSALATSIEEAFGIPIEIVSGGNSANLNWVFAGDDAGRINNLRLGEAILVGREPLHRCPIDGLYTDAFSLVAEVIESKSKPTQPWGTVAQSAFVDTAQLHVSDRGVKEHCIQAILAVGHQDTDPGGLRLEPGVTILGASSDHLVVDTGSLSRPVGSEMSLQPNYGALVRAMTSPFVTRVWKPCHETISAHQTKT